MNIARQNLRLIKAPPWLSLNYTPSFQKFTNRLAVSVPLNSTRSALFLSDVFGKSVTAPTAKRIPVVTINHGRKRTDDYAWMEDLNDPDLIKYIKEENTYADKIMNSVDSIILQKILVREMRKKLYTPKLMPPIVTEANGYGYYSKTSEKGILYCRKLLGGSQEEILLDTGSLPLTEPTIKKVLLSHDHRIFSYISEREGMEVGTLTFRYLEDEGIEAEVLEGVFNFVWAADGKTVYYTTTNEELRPCKVFVHRLGTVQEKDILIYEEPDESAFVDVAISKDYKFITINSNSLATSEVRVIDAQYDFSLGMRPLARIIEPRTPGLEYFVDHHEDHFYILTNTGNGGNFKLVQARDDAPSREHWENLIVTKDTEKIEEVDLYKNYAVVYVKRDCLPVMFCYDLSTFERHEIPLPEQICAISPNNNLQYATNTVRFDINSPYAHESTYDYDISKRKLSPVRVHPINRFDRSRFTAQLVHAPTRDGIKVPVTLLHRQGLQLHGRNPVLMQSYGAYGISTEAGFHIEYFPLLERGWVIALTHVRGGSEFGKSWYEDGKLGKKRNSFNDFIDVAQFLIAQNFTSPRYLAAMGASAGGLLVGAMSIMRPDLFRSLILRVPFVDPLSAMLNPSLPLTRIEYNEWGNPTMDQDAYDNIASYSPYENLQGFFSASGYRLPSLLITAGFKDQRVACWQSLKFVAKVRSRITSEEQRRVLVKIEEDRGHFGAQEDQEGRLGDLAVELAFLISTVQGGGPG